MNRCKGENIHVRDMVLVHDMSSEWGLSLSHWYPGSGVVLDCIDS